MVATLLGLCCGVAAESPLPWSLSFSGGGFRALAGAFGVMRKLNNTIKIDTISSNSGGTWFLSQYLYDEAFHASVTGYDDHYRRFLFTDLLETMPSILKNKLLGRDWETIIDQMYDAHRSPTRHLARVNVTRSQRLDHRTTDVLFCAALPQKSLMAGQAVVELRLADGNITAPLLPMAYRIPAGEAPRMSGQRTLNPNSAPETGGGARVMDGACCPDVPPPRRQRQPSRDCGPAAPDHS